jgi:hypothetical protein
LRDPVSLSAIPVLTQLSLCKFSLTKNVCTFSFGKVFLYTPSKVFNENSRFWWLGFGKHLVRKPEKEKSQNINEKSIFLFVILTILEAKIVFCVCL